MVEEKETLHSNVQGGPDKDRVKQLAKPISFRGCYSLCKSISPVKLLLNTCVKKLCIPSFYNYIPAFGKKREAPNSAVNSLNFHLRSTNVDALNNVETQTPDPSKDADIASNDKGQRDFIKEAFRQRGPEQKVFRGEVVEKKSLTNAFLKCYSVCRTIPKWETQDCVRLLCGAFSQGHYFRFGKRGGTTLAHDVSDASDVIDKNAVIHAPDNLNLARPQDANFAADTAYAFDVRDQYDVIQSADVMQPRELMKKRSQAARLNECWKICTSMFSHHSLLNRCVRKLCTAGATGYFGRFGKRGELSLHRLEKEDKIYREEELDSSRIYKEEENANEGRNNKANNEETKTGRANERVVKEDRLKRKRRRKGRKKRDMVMSRIR
jgi:hypothetical protein